MPSARTAENTSSVGVGRRARHPRQVGVEQVFRIALGAQTGVHLLARQAAGREPLPQLRHQVGTRLQENLRLLRRRPSGRHLGADETREQKRSGHDE